MRNNRGSVLALAGAFATVLFVASAPQQALAINDSKNIGDGAAKGQASEGTVQPTGSCNPGMAVKNSGVPKNTTLTAQPGSGCANPAPSGTKTGNGAQPITKTWDASSPK
jgi:hypothetical protein